MPEDIPPMDKVGELESGGGGAADRDGVEDPAKRRSLQTVGAWAGLAATGLSLLHGHNEGAPLGIAIREVERRLRSGDLAEILEYGTPGQVWDAFFGPNAEVSGFGRERLEDTLLDPSNPRVLETFPSIYIGICTEPPAHDMSEGKLVPFIAIRNNSARHPEPNREFLENVAYSGNGILLPWPNAERFVVLTNAHVARPLAEQVMGITFRKHPRGADLAIMSIPRRDCKVLGVELGEQQITPRVDLPSRDKDFHGHFAVVASIDPDASAKGGIKFYGGFLVSEHRSAGLVRALFGAPIRPDSEEGYFLVGVPAEQMYLVGHVFDSPFSVAPDARSDGGVLLFPHPYAQGTSGSPVLLAQPDGSLMRNGEVSVVGLVTSFYPATHMEGAGPKQTCCGGLMYVSRTDLEAFEDYP